MWRKDLGEHPNHGDLLEMYPGKDCLLTVLGDLGLWVDLSCVRFMLCPVGFNCYSVLILRVVLRDLCVQFLECCYSPLMRVVRVSVYLMSVHACFDTRTAVYCMHWLISTHLIKELQGN